MRMGLLPCPPYRAGACLTPLPPPTHWHSPPRSSHPTPPPILLFPIYPHPSLHHPPPAPPASRPSRRFPQTELERGAAHLQELTQRLDGSEEAQEEGLTALRRENKVASPRGVTLIGIFETTAKSQVVHFLRCDREKNCRGKTRQIRIFLRHIRLITDQCDPSHPFQELTFRLNNAEQKLDLALQELSETATKVEGVGTMGRSCLLAIVAASHSNPRVCRRRTPHRPTSDIS